MNKTTYIFILLGIFGCTEKTAEQKLFDEIRERIKTEMLPKFKDPASYQEASFEIEDTVTTRENIANKGNLQYFVDDLASKKISLATYGGNEIVSKSSIETDIRATEQIIKKMEDGINLEPKGKIAYLIIAHTYRAKNGFGALDLGRMMIEYHPDQSEPDKRFIIETER